MVSTELAVERLAEASGFGSSRQFRRVWRKFEGTSASSQAAVRASRSVNLITRLRTLDGLRVAQIAHRSLDPECCFER